MAKTNSSDEQLRSSSSRTLSLETTLDEEQDAASEKVASALLRHHSIFRKYETFTHTGTETVYQLDRVLLLTQNAFFKTSKRCMLVENN